MEAVKPAFHIAVFMIAMAYNLRRAVTIVALRDGLAA